MIRTSLGAALRWVAFLALSVPICAQSTGFRPIAHWNYVPHQRIDAPTFVGVVAFHAAGVDVEFRVDGVLVWVADSPSFNPASGVWEYSTPLLPQYAPDGRYQLDARIVPRDPTAPAYDLESLSFYANAGGSLSVPGETWVATWGHDGSGNGTRSAPFRTIRKALLETPAGGLVRLEAGTYECDAMRAGSGRTYWTRITPAPGTARADVRIRGGRPSTQRLRWQGVTIFSDSRSGRYDTILDGEGGAHEVWLDDCHCLNVHGRYAASTTTFGNRYIPYVTGGLTTDMANGPGAKLIRNHRIERLTSDAWSGSSKLVVNCSCVDVDAGPTAAHPDFHQAYAVAPNFVQNVILYNVRGFDCAAQGFFGSRLRNSAFVNVLFEKTAATTFQSQYAGPVENVLFWHVGLPNQSWLWRGRNGSGLRARNVQVYNSVLTNMSLIENASADGLSIDANHFTGGAMMGTGRTTGSAGFVNPGRSDYRLRPDAPAAGGGRHLPCVVTDLDGRPFRPVDRNRGPFAGEPVVEHGRRR